MSWNEMLLAMQPSLGDSRVSYDGDVKYIITDDILLSSLNTRLDIINPKLHITMEELKIACQEKYPYKFI